MPITLKQHVKRLPNGNKIRGVKCLVGLSVNTRQELEDYLNSMNKSLNWLVRQLVLQELVDQKLNDKTC